MNYKLCIPTAGLGSRLGGKTTYLNKALISVAGRPGISHLIEKFDTSIPIVIAVGYKGELVQELLPLIYPDRHFEFISVRPFDGPGSGLGWSLLSCIDQLQCPFVFASCDTIVTEAIPKPDRNWMGIASPRDSKSYRTVRLAKDQKVTEICEKGASGAVYPYIGLAGVADYLEFWKSMQDGDRQLVIGRGESEGLRGILSQGIQGVSFNWYDTGNLEELKRTEEALAISDAPHILDKADEAIWFVGNEVTKFSIDEKFIVNRVKRAKVLEGFCPPIARSTAHAYVYPKAKGQVFSDLVTLPLFRKLLEFLKKFWDLGYPLSRQENQDLRTACKDFYRAKTLKRIEQFYTMQHFVDGDQMINGIPVPSLDLLLKSIHWDKMEEAVPVRLHGDLHFENILFDRASERFTLLDWRQDFGGILEYGDIYYDLAKLKHGLIINHELITQNHFQVVHEGNEVKFEFLRKSMLVECENEFDLFLEREGFDVQKVAILTSLIFLNIAPLHHYPYNWLLFYLGKSGLAKTLKFT